MIKYNKKGEWLRGLVWSTRGLVPLHKIIRIRMVSPATGKQVQTIAICRRHTEGKFKGHFEIDLTTHRDTFKKASQHRWTIGRRRWRFIYLLDSLAHELAHTVVWEHYPEHNKLQGQIMNRFWRYLKRRNIDIKDYYTFEYWKEL